MICPRCGQVISDTETICPFCYQEIDKNVKFNDYRKDGFVQVQTANDGNSAEPVNYTPKYFNIAEFNIFVIAVVYILFVSVFTVFSLRFVQNTTIEFVPEYVPATTASTSPKNTESTPPKNTVKKVTIKNLLGSWKIKGAKETPTTAIPYYSFSEDGVAQENYGSMTSAGTYKDLSEDGKNIVYIMIENGMRGSYYFDYSGNKKDGYELTLENVTNGAIYILEKATAKAKKLAPANDVKLDKKLYGYWLNSKVNKSYEFFKDGTVTRVTGGTTTEGIWEITDDKVITIQYIKEEVKSINLDYVLKKNKLTITSTTYTKTEKTKQEGEE